MSTKVENMTPEEAVLKEMEGKWYCLYPHMHNKFIDNIVQTVLISDPKRREKKEIYQNQTALITGLCSALNCAPGLIAFTFHELVEENQKLLNALKDAVLLLEHGDFRNGVEHNGIDEGDVRAGEMIDRIHLVINAGEGLNK